MAVPSVSDLRAAFPEFGTGSSDGAPDSLVQSAINQAADLCDEEVYLDRHTQAILYHAADQLARSPFARDLKLVGKEGDTAYSKRADRLMRISACGIRGF